MKDYKKILEGVVNIINTTEKSDIGFANICTYIGEKCPELKEKESGDEKIRKALISILKSDFEKDTAIFGISVGQIIDWLGKQDHEPKWSHHKVDLSNCSEEYRKAYYDGWNNCNMQHSQCESEKNDVLKCLINGLKFYYEDNHEATWGTDKWSMPVKHIIDVLEKQGEQKPAEWSEEDELHIKELESLVKQVWATAEHKNDKDTIYKMSNLSFFLKTLKPQLKQEWSEEDETSIAVNNPDAYKIGFADGEAHAKEEQWKPSDEQMDALLYIFRYYAPEATDKLAWESLQTLELMLAQLKKLRGE